MGKKVKNAKNADSVKKMSAKQLEATQAIKTLAAQKGIMVTSSWASRKDLRPEVGEVRDTMWGIEKGQKVLVVLNSTGTEVKAYAEPQVKFPNMHSIKF